MGKEKHDVKFEQNSHGHQIHSKCNHKAKYTGSICLKRTLKHAFYDKIGKNCFVNFFRARLLPIAIGKIDVKKSMLNE